MTKQPNGAVPSVGLLVLLAAAACSYQTDFDKPLVFPEVFPEEVRVPCRDDCDCVLMGPCRTCRKDPGAAEGVCVLPETAEKDGDGFVARDCTVDLSCCAGQPQEYCPRPGDDCDDNDGEIHPGKVDACNGIDDNCNGFVDEDTATFGLDRNTRKTLSRGYEFSFCSAGSSTIVAWSETVSNDTVYAGYFDAGGNLINQQVLTQTGMQPAVVCHGELGPAAAVWADREYGNTDIVLELLDSEGNPTGRRTTFPGDGFLSTDPAAAYLQEDHLVGAAWLSHDIDDSRVVRVEFQAFGRHDLAPLSPEPVAVSEPFALPAYPPASPAYVVEKLSVEPFKIGPDRKGFALLWVESDGIRFAEIKCGKPTGSNEVTCGLTSLTWPEGALRGVQFPALRWAGDSFYVAYAVADGAEGAPLLPKLRVLRILPEGIEGWRFEDLALPGIEFPRDANHPSLAASGGASKEVILAWSDGWKGFGFRQVLFARLALDEAARALRPVTSEPVLEISDEEGRAGYPLVARRQAGGYVVGWTQADETDGGIVILTGAVECKE